MFRPTPIAFLALASSSVAAGETAETPLRYRGAPAELIVSEVSDRTVRIEVAPLAGDGTPRPAEESAVLVPFPSTEKLRVRSLSGEKELRVGRLRVTIRPEPLTVTLRREDGRTVRELVLAGDPPGGF